MSAGMKGPLGRLTLNFSSADDSNLSKKRKKNRDMIALPASSTSYSQLIILLGCEDSRSINRIWAIILANHT